MSRRRRGLSTPLALLAGFALCLAIGNLITTAALAALAAGLILGGLAAFGAAGARRRIRRAAAPRRARVTIRPGPAAQAAPVASARQPGPAADWLAERTYAADDPANVQYHDPRAALRATLRARADQVSKHIPPPAQPRER